MRKERIKFVEEELARYEMLMAAAIPGTEEYASIKKDYKDYMDIYRELYPKNIWNNAIDICKIIVPAAVSVGLGIYAYHKNENLEDKDGDVWREARRR